MLLVAHVAYLIIVPQQSDSILVFQLTPSSESTYVSIHNVHFKKEKIQLQ